MITQENIPLSDCCGAIILKDERRKLFICKDCKKPCSVRSPLHPPVECRAYDYAGDCEHMHP